MELEWRGGRFVLAFKLLPLRTTSLRFKSLRRSETPYRSRVNAGLGGVAGLTHEHDGKLKGIQGYAGCSKMAVQWLFFCPVWDVSQLTQFPDQPEREREAHTQDSYPSSTVPSPIYPLQKLKGIFFPFFIRIFKGCSTRSATAASLYVYI